MPEHDGLDYVLGTGDEEMRRLGLQHQVWRPLARDCRQRAGITVGSRVLDVGAGPGFAAPDLAETVGPGGEVVAVELSRADEAWAASVRREFAAAEASPHTLMLTPMVLEIIARRRPHDAPDET